VSVCDKCSSRGITAQITVLPISSSDETAGRKGHDGKDSVLPLASLFCGRRCSCIAFTGAFEMMHPVITTQTGNLAGVSAYFCKECRILKYLVSNTVCDTVIRKSLQTIII
jgi:hypothetical protein